MDRFKSLLERFEWDKYKTHVRAAEYRELIKIIAEVGELPKDAVMNIGGTAISRYMVDEVFLTLTDEHLLSVIDKFSKIDFPVRNKKAYLRTMLYNEAFELEATISNDVSVDEAKRRYGYV